MTGYATSTALISSQAANLFTGVGNLLLTVLPYAIGMLIFYIGWNWVRKAIGGR